MLDQDRYAKAVQQLTEQEYDVRPNDSGYIVRHRHDASDVSLVNNLDELADLADLFEWRALNQGNSG